MEERFWYKHTASAWEQEFRPAISVRIADEYGVSVPEPGIKVDVDPSTLVEEVYLDPSPSDIKSTAIRNALQAYGLEDRLRVSSMLGILR